MAGQRKPRSKKADFITPDEIASALSALDLRVRLMDVGPRSTPEQAMEIARAMGIETTADAIMTEVQVQRTRRRRQRARTSVVVRPPSRKISVASNVIVYLAVAACLAAWTIWSIVSGSHHSLPAR